VLVGWSTAEEAERRGIEVITDDRLALVQRLREMAATLVTKTDSVACVDLLNRLEKEIKNAAE
jgi:hypothetical protein